MSKRRSSASASSSPISAASVVLFSLFVLLPNVFFFLGKATATAAAESIVNEERDIRIFNHAGVKIELYWINPDTREGHLMTVAGVGLYHGAQMPLQSFVGHEFEVRELPSIETGRCAGANRKSSSNDNNEDNGNSMEGQCQIGTFIVTRYDDQGEWQELNHQRTHTNIELDIFHRSFYYVAVSYADLLNSKLSSI
jgi:hypothetical protein